jgi:CBS domain containing-hemolysin-like protein
MTLIAFVPFFANAEGALAHEWQVSGSSLLLDASIILFFVLLNGFFVAAEFALVKIRESQVEQAVEEGMAGAKLVQHMTQHLDAYLSATQLSITLTSIGLGMVGEPVVAGLVQPLLFKVGVTSEIAIHSISLGVAYAIVTYLHVVLGELTPKALAIRKALPTALATAPVLHICYLCLRPGIWILRGSARFLLRRLFQIKPVSEGELTHSEEELRHIVAESEKSKRVTETEKDILLNALALNDRCVRDVMTPRNQVVSLDLDESFETNLKLAVESKHTRLPLVEGHLDHSVGVIHIKDLLPLVGQPNPDLRKIKRELVPVPEMMPIDKLLRQFLDRHMHIALVIDEFGGAVGIVTLDNVLEEIVGDIQDEFDFEKPEFRPINADEFEVDGSLNLYELKDHAEIEVESDEVTTIGGYVTHMLGHLPKPGETVEIGEYDVQVTKVDPRRILHLHFKRHSRTAGESFSSADLEA